MIVNIPFEVGLPTFDLAPQAIVDLQNIVNLLKASPFNKASLQPRTALSVSDDGGPQLLQGRQTTLRNYFESLGLSSQVTILVGSNSYKANFDVLVSMSIINISIN